MTSEPIWQAGAGAVSDRLQQGAVTPEHVLDCVIDRFHQINGSINAFACFDEAGAREAAMAAGERQRAGKRAGPLDGVPVAIKDNLHVAGLPATWGSELFRDFVPDRDDICVERLRNSGAVVVGKTTTPEFALSGRTESRLFGVTRNPHDLSLTPGGSSGGAAAAVAAGIIPLAVGTDAGGSIRTPAALTGLVGLRPPNGLIPRRHGFPPMALDFQAIGLMARSIDDVEMLLSAVAGPDARDPASLSLTHSSLPERCRIGWFDSVLEDGSDTEVSDSVREMAGALAEAGHQVARVPAPYDLNLLRSAWSVISAVGAARVAENHPDWSERLTAPMVALVEQGRGIPATHYVKALDRLQTFRAETSERWGDYDLILSPTTPAPAWPHGLEAPAVIGGVPGSSDLQHMFCGWVNAMGYGAISVPSRPHPDGRPIGVQLVARAPHWRDMMLVARRVEELSGWKLALPEIALK